jgi:putative sterol carrier protein
VVRFWKAPERLADIQRGVVPDTPGDIAWQPRCRPRRQVCKARLRCGDKTVFVTPNRVDVNVNPKLYAPSANARQTQRDEENGMSVQEIADKIRSRVASAGFDRSVKFDTGADGVIVIDGATISTDDAPADCTIKLSLDDLDSLISGDLNPTMAFMTGKIKVEGDMSVAMALSQLIG